MDTMWIEILAVHIESADEREGNAKFGRNFYRGELRRIDKERGIEFIAKGAAREAKDRSANIPRPAIRLHIDDVHISTASEAQ